MSFIVDGDWLLCQKKWGKCDKWGNIIDGYAQIVKNQGNHAINVVNVAVVFNGYKVLTKDHTHQS